MDDATTILMLLRCSEASKVPARPERSATICRRSSSSFSIDRLSSALVSSDIESLESAACVRS